MNINIYIKSFNRPYLLHRTLQSIYHFLEKFDGQIIILDDGTPQKYLDKLLILFPDIQIVKSPLYDEKEQKISENKIPLKKIPANFWRDQIAEGTEHFILLEDDMWFCQSIDFPAFKKQIVYEKMDMIRFFWLKNADLISNRKISENDFFSIVSPKLLVNNPALFDMIFRTNRLKLGSFVNRFKNINKEILKYYQLFAVAGALFSKKYYLACWEQNQENVDELSQIYQLLKNKALMRVGNTNSEILKITCKTSASFINKENLGDFFNVFEVNKMLNDSWLQNDTYNVDDFDKDIPTDWIENCFRRYGGSIKTTFEQWEKWYEAFKKSYEKIGCSL